MDRVTSAHDSGGYSTARRDDLAVAVTTRRRIPTWLENAVRQAERSAADDRSTLPLVSWEDSSRDDPLVVMRLKDFERLAAVEADAGSERAAKNARTAALEIYTDGGCIGNPGKGAWAAVIYDGPKPTEISGTERRTTNNRMELRAAVEGLRQLQEPSRIRLYSDSAYLVNGMRQRWYDRWEQNGWKTASKKPVQNAELWRELLALSRCHDVEYVKVHGHAGVPANERCHALAQLAMDQ